MSVLKYLGTFATFFKVRRDKPIVDNPIFRLHYRFTFIYFLAASALITAVDLFGKPINCIVENFNRPEILNTYCWIQHTFTIPVAADQKHPGVGPWSNTSERRIHTYYQWVPFVLFFQGILFYLPHWIWKRQEAGIVHQLAKGAREVTLERMKESEEEKKDRRSLLSDYLHETMGTRGYLGVSHVFCELFNLVNAMGSIYLIDMFLGGTFFDYGWKVFELNSMDQENRRDRMVEVFPRMAKCTFSKFGSSGTVERHDALCILPLNVLNEKIYIFLWFWLIVLSTLSIFALFYRTLVVISPVFRQYVFRRILPTADPDSTSVLSKRLGYSDCHLLFLLGKNLQSAPFRELMDDLAHHVDHSHIEA